jgi:glycosyltransferase involved in cell wall biosynthesis
VAAAGREPAASVTFRFSVIIPTYNRLELLKATLASVWQQAFTDFEVIVVDDGSTDGTADYLKAMDGRLRTARQENCGPGAARNLGAATAHGEYVAFLDSDDLWFPWTLETYDAMVERYERPALVGGRCLEFQRADELLQCRPAPASGEWFPDYLASWRQPYAVGSGTAVIRRDLFNDVGGFSTEKVNLEDHDIVLRLGEATGFVQIVAPATVGWRRHPGSQTLDIAKSVAGVGRLIAMEEGGAYPGGRTRRHARLQILTRHVRPVTLACLQVGLAREAWAAYRRTFGWHLRLRRWKYLLAFPLRLAASAVTRRMAGAAGT